ncbi:hypothetical protein EZS27_001201 [termite gut metagenome]|uniref:Transmembrane protein n=1 Tax=termite gut metagenome TaxID=433724 RepID=A0A5J4T0A0_9ZZZZ
MFFNDLYRHSSLAARRHPMYDKNKFGKFFMYLMLICWVGYLIFLGTTLAVTLKNSSSGMEPYHIINKGLLVFILLDFLMRIPFQKTPTQAVKPYLLLPVKKDRLLDFLLLRSGLSGFNAIWLFFFIPFAVITIMQFYGIAGIITYSLGICLLMVLNNYWYLLCRTLLNERIWWIALPVAVYGILAVVEFVPDNHLLSTFTMNLGEAFITGNVLAFLGVLALIALVWLVNRNIMRQLVYSEINKVEDTKVKHVSEYKFLERYGEVGEFFRLELKMLTRNKRCKMSLRTVSIVVIVFSLALSFSTIYDNASMKSFIVIYSFVVFGSVILSQIMCFEGNYLDGLMTRKESIFNLLKAKYYLYSIVALIPFVLMIPAMVTGKLPVFFAISLMFFSIGVIYFLLFQMAVYNNKTVPLNEGLSGKQNTGTSYQNFVVMGILFFPVILSRLLDIFLGENVARCILLILGLAFVLTAHIWIKNVYVRFMKRRYQNMEGFRNTRG